MRLSPTSILLEGRRALVTGAAQGIGAATAVGLARFGADVAMVDRQGDKLAQTIERVESLGREAPSLVADVRDTASMTDWIEDLSVTWPSLHVLVNNAGGGFVADVCELSANAQAALIAENFTQVADITRLCRPLLAAGSDKPGGASIINITSVEAHRAGPGFGVYSAMKAAVANLTRTLALELADERIRVNAIAPDMIPTPGDEQLTADSGALDEPGWSPTPWPDAGSPEDIAAAVIWLAGPMSGFVTGTTVHVDGGTLASSGWKQRTSDGKWLL
ncbi:MAG: SDR family oxidoreductase [Microthrixaceae bacterium]|nr:SDR family oxidoreductase [Microthrixaceae bacterium]